MASPFPGMDPYLQYHWGDVQTSIVTYARDQLQKVLPRDLRARVEERLVVAEPPGQRSIFPDVRVFDSSRKPRRQANGAAGVTTLEPLVILLDEPETRRFLEVREVGPNERLVTVVEVLSPTNKRRGAPQKEYHKKQEELIASRVSLVEIDLIRGGDWVVAVPRESVPAAARTPYRVVARRGWDSSTVEYYPIALRQSLPTIRVPLRHTDADVSLDLQTLLDQAYDNGAYDDIDYDKEPRPRLEAADARWADRLLREAGLRQRRRSRKKSN